MIRGIEMIYGVGGKSVIYEMVKLAGPLPPSWMAYWDVESFENFRAKHDGLSRFLHRSHRLT